MHTSTQESTVLDKLCFFVCLDFLIAIAKRDAFTLFVRDIMLYKTSVLLLLLLLIQIVCCEKNNQGDGS